MKVFGYEVPHYSEPEFKVYLRGFIKRHFSFRKKKRVSTTLTLSSKYYMNPVDYWYQTNPFLREFMESYWKANEQLLPKDQMGEDMRHLFVDCVLYDKLHAMSVLATLKLIKE